MDIRFLSIAEDELENAIVYYEGKEKGLGLRFLAEINCLDRIQHYPHAWFQFSKNTKRCRTKVFPYGVIYQIEKEEIVIVAVASLLRDPDYWKDRV